MSSTLLGICAIVALLVIVFGFYFLPKLYKAYLRILVGLGLLALLWFTSEFQGRSMKLFFSFFIGASVVQAFLYLRAVRRERESEETVSLP